MTIRCKLFILHSALFILLFASLLPVSAQQNADAVKNINAVKRDTTYLYAEATMSHPDSAFFGAKAILEMKVKDWVKVRYPADSVDVCIAKAKEHSFEIHTRRGQLFRAFVYVNKRDILPVTDRNEVVVFQVSQSASEQTPSTPVEIISEDAPVTEEQSASEKEPVVITLTEEEQKMIGINNLSELNTYVSKLRNSQRLNGYGKHRTMPKDQFCHIFVCDKQGTVLARLRHQSDDTCINLTTLQPDTVENYHTGAIWFQIKD
ncbi:MAG: hypothetical protein J5545_09130 [Bacteroidaceae bacterium]|nr:hypothetical protein [Bacteroidaceae bacterium]